MKCGFCGAENDITAKKCTTCGAPLEKQLRPQMLPGREIVQFQGRMNSDRPNVESPGAAKKYLIMFLLGCIMHDIVLASCVSFPAAFYVFLTASLVFLCGALYKLGYFSKLFWTAAPVLIVETVLLAALGFKGFFVKSYNRYLIGALAAVFLARRVLCFLGAAKLSKPSVAHLWRICSVVLPCLVAFITVYMVGPVEFQRLFVAEGEGNPAVFYILAMFFVIGWGALEVYIRILWVYTVRGLSELAEQEKRNRK